MSSCEFSKVANFGDSNIPVPKRTVAGTRRSKGCTQLPELQKYIETIIKASNESESEGPPSPDKAKGPQKDRKYGKHSVCKGIDYSAKPEKVKFEMQVTASKSKNKAKTPCPEAVSSGDEIANTFVHTDFEDPRNWKTDDRNQSPNSELGNFLKQCFPNPYHLGNVTADLTPERQQEDDDLGDETLDSVPISDVCTQTESEMTNYALVVADSEIKLCTRGSNTSSKMELAPSLERSNTAVTVKRPESRRGGTRGRNASVRRAPTPSKTTLVNGSSHSTINISSKGSSLESVSVASLNRTTTPRQNSRKSNSTSRKSSRNEMKLTSSREDFSEETFSDYDLKKLKLLNTTDSDDSSMKCTEQSKDPCDDFLSRTPSSAFDDMYDPNEFSDLRQILDVMNKATETFLEISLKTDQNPVPDDPGDAEESDKLTESVTALWEKEPATQQSDDRKTQEDEPEEKDSGTKPMEAAIENTELRNSEEGDKRKSGDGSLVNLLLREEKPESVNCGKEETPDAPEPGPSKEEEKQENSSKHEEVTNTCLILGDLERVDSPEEDQEAGQKIDEVLKFMYDCLKKFSSQEKELMGGEEPASVEDRKPKPSVTNIAQERTKSSLLPKRSNTASAEEPTESLVVESYPRVKEIQSENSTMMDETKRKPPVRARCRKRHDKNSPLAAAEAPPSVSRPPQTSRGPEIHPTADAAPIVPTVEGQNELGSYSEQPPASAPAASDSHTAKTIQPHSVKLKKGKTDTQKTIKDVLDTEEKLLANYLSSKPPEKKTPEKSGDSKSRKSGNHVVIRSGRTTTYSILNDLKRSNSNFVICVSSLPRSLRTMAANRTSLTLSPSLSLSLNKAWDIKPLPYFRKLSLKKIPVILDIPRSALELSYNVRQGGLLTVEKGRVAHVARPIGLGLTISYSKSEQEHSLKNSECLISIKIKPMKKSLFVESSSTGCILKPFPVSDSTTTDGSSSVQTEGNQRVDCLLEALEKTEGRLRLLEQNEFITTESLSSCSANEPGKCDSSEIDWEGENGHEKVHNLLLRTYSLQQKLHQYLYKMTCFQQPPLICPLTQDYCSHLGVVITDHTDLKILPEKKVSKVVMTRQPVKEETTSVEVQTSDHALSSRSSSERNKQTGENEREGKDVEEERDAKNEDDDNSSVCSFKSSNDFSNDPNEVSNLENKPEFPDKIKGNDFLKKIINEIDSFRQNFGKTVGEDHFCLSVKGNRNSSESLKENRLAEYDGKTPAKVLKTVFKGQKSMTELTIGLKDVPMTRVSNISVEKHKFSPSHTKISICIIKEKPELAEKANTPNSMFKSGSSAPQHKFSNMYFDQIRPSLSRCRTEYSRIDDDLSKTSESVIESSEDDDDDFKSVASSLSVPDMGATKGDQKEAKDEAQPSPPPPPPKTFTKYRFDFYRKMDMSLGSNQPKPKPLSSSTVCRYKDFEPLKQALTEMQIRMRSIQQDTIYGSNDYYERALRLAKMSAGYCQNCGNRAVIPKDTFGYYRTLLPRRHASHRHSHPFKMAATPNPNYLSFRSTNREVSDSLCDVDMKHSSSYLPNQKTRPGGAFVRHSPPVLM